jgi:hypothetical protein
MVCTFTLHVSYGSVRRGDNDYITFTSDCSPRNFVHAGDALYEQGINLKRHEADDETSFDYDSDEDPSAVQGAILVLNKRAFIPREDAIVRGDFTMFTTDRGEKCLREYEEAFTVSFVRNHFAVPDAVGKVIFDFWRSEPIPCLVLEPGDVIVAMDNGHGVAVARRNQNQKPIDKFEEWKQTMVWDLSWKAPPVEVAAYPFEEEFAKFERRKRRGLK